MAGVFEDESRLMDLSLQMDTNASMLVDTTLGFLAAGASPVRGGGTGMGTRSSSRAGLGRLASSPQKRQKLMRPEPSRKAGAQAVPIDDLDEEELERLAWEEEARNARSRPPRQAKATASEAALAPSVTTSKAPQTLRPPEQSAKGKRTPARPTALPKPSAAQKVAKPAAAVSQKAPATASKLASPTKKPKAAPKSAPAPSAAPKKASSASQPSVPASASTSKAPAPSAVSPQRRAPSPRRSPERLRSPRKPSPVKAPAPTRIPSVSLAATLAASEASRKERRRRLGLPPLPGDAPDTSAPSGDAGTETLASTSAAAADESTGKGKAPRAASPDAPPPASASAPVPQPTRRKSERLEDMQPAQSAPEAAAPAAKGRKSPAQKDEGGPSKKQRKAEEVSKPAVTEQGPAQAPSSQSRTPAVAHRTLSRAAGPSDANASVISATPAQPSSMPPPMSSTPAGVVVPRRGRPSRSPVRRRPTRLSPLYEQDSSHEASAAQPGADVQASGSALSPAVDEPAEAMREPEQETGTQGIEDSGVSGPAHAAPSPARSTHSTRPRRSTRLSLQSQSGAEPPAETTPTAEEGVSQGLEGGGQEIEDQGGEMLLEEQEEAREEEADGYELHKEEEHDAPIQAQFAFEFVEEPAHNRRRAKPVVLTVPRGFTFTSGSKSRAAAAAPRPAPAPVGRSTGAASKPAQSRMSTTRGKSPPRKAASSTSRAAKPIAAPNLTVTRAAAAGKVRAPATVPRNQAAGAAAAAAAAPRSAYRMTPAGVPSAAAAKGTAAAPAGYRVTSTGLLVPVPSATAFSFNSVTASSAAAGSSSR